MSDEIDIIRHGLEEFTRDVDEEYYLTASGLKEQADFSRIFEKHNRLFTRETIDKVQKRLRAASGDEARRLRFLRAFIVGDFLENHVKGLSDKFLTQEAQATIIVDDQELPFRQSAVVLTNETDRARRTRIFDARNLIIERLNHVLRARMETLHSVSQELGYRNYTTLYEDLKGIGIHRLEKLLVPFMEKTEKLYSDKMDEALFDKTGVKLIESEKHDVSYVFRAKEYDHYFVGQTAVAILGKTLGGMGINLRRQTNIHIDLEERPKKTPRPFVSPISVPNDIRLVVMPQGGHDDYAALLHEAGHAEHYGSIQPDLPMEYRYLGDNSLTEGWAFLLEYLMSSRNWLAMFTTMKEPDGYLEFVHLYKLYFLRRYIAKLSYELLLHTQGLEGAPENYQKTMERALKSNHPQSHYLIDVDDGFYSANYLRAWMFEAQIRDRLINDYGEGWFGKKEAGAQLQKWWSLGQKYSVEEILRDLGYRGLDPGPLLKEIEKNLN